MKASETKKLIEAKKFIIKTFGELYANGGEAIRDDVFWEKAKESGAYDGGYGETVSNALEELVEVEFVRSSDGDVKYRVFRLKGI